MTSRRRFVPFALVGIAVAAVTVAASGRQTKPQDPAFSFRSAVDLISVTATVTDPSGRFVPNLKRDDFVIYEDGKPQPVSQFEAERVAVSLGLAIDSSGSMIGDKITAAREALDRFLFKLLGSDDEVFLYRFDAQPHLLQGWTRDRQAVGRAVDSIHPNGGTAIYDTVAEATKLAQSGTRRKKALLVVSDGNDTDSHMHLEELQRVIRESEVMVYAIAVDASGDDSRSRSARSTTPSTSSTPSYPVPLPFPGKAPPPQPPPASRPPTPSSGPHPKGGTERVNVDALRSFTDDTGGRTELIVSSRDLDPATAGIASELSQQYFLGYVSAAPKDGKWHTIEVRVRKSGVTVRARRGFIAG